jgi:LacI family transcriptional regulator
MNQSLKTGPIALKDVAREAGVSTATVDRVLHGRPGVREATVRRVKETIERLGFRPNAAAAELARARSVRFGFVMPENTNAFMEEIVANLAKMRPMLSASRISLDVVGTNVFDPETLATTLETAGPRFDGIAVVALDHPRVRAAIDALAETGIDVVTLVSDVPSSRRLHYIGIDNTAAGRTAGSLIGRFSAGRTGKVAMIAGSLSLRDHAERLFGMTQVIAAEYPNLAFLPVAQGCDDDARNAEITRHFVDENPDLVAVYNIGAGTAGVGQTLIDAGKARDIVFVAHDVTPLTQRYLLLGVADAVISQNPGRQARSAVRVLTALSRREPPLAEQEYIGVEIVMRDNMP